ncbi:MAG TPA: hypothetical protein DD706_23805 [Nitrospiraceae bacterium]|nr:hypothetical protein [Nitrospiraceae bacterium]
MSQLVGFRKTTFRIVDLGGVRGFPKTGKRQQPENGLQLDSAGSRQCAISRPIGGNQVVQVGLE